jgi:hypothetical protein
MSGEYGLVTIWRALKADFLSLASFQVGLYGWMVIYQIAIWNYRLEMDNVVYWWTMPIQVMTQVPTWSPLVSLPRSPLQQKQTPDSDQVLTDTQLMHKWQQGMVQQPQMLTDMATASQIRQSKDLSQAPDDASCEFD